ncbi:MAG: hypothetical protein LLF94_05910 [Chlamydiales bacterium]|nr:hypothetical protein [Chlamydiales bacterium]
MITDHFRTVTFDYNLAVQYDLNIAIVYAWIVEAIQLNIKKNDPIFYREEKWWVCVSVQTLHHYLPFLTWVQIRRAVRVLVQQGILVRGRFTKQNWDNTAWYSLP